MKRQRFRVPLVALLILSAACATVGTGDPVVVKAEDVLSNSLTTYQAAMSYHFANSTKESPAVYKTFEAVRLNFPEGWKNLYDTLQAYKANRTTAGADRVNALLTALQNLVRSVAPLIGG